MRRAKLSLGLILAITLFASAVPAAASHPAPLSAAATGTGRLDGGPLTSCGFEPIGAGMYTCASSQTHEMILGSNSCSGNTDGSPGPYGLVACDLWMDGIQLVPVNGAGPNCQIFGGSGGQGAYRYVKDGAEVVVELRDIGWQAATLVEPVFGSTYLIPLQGNYAHDGETRPFIGEVHLSTYRCFGPSYTGENAFSWHGSLTLL